MLKMYFVLSLLVVVTAANGQQIRSAGSRLKVLSEHRKYGLKLDLDGEAAYQNLLPMAVEVLDLKGQPVWLEAAYSELRINGKTLEFNGAIASPNGSVFHFTDRYLALDDSGTFEVDRKVFVAAASDGDAGFSTRLSFQRNIPASMDKYDFFVPSVWYKDNKYVSAKALASNYQDNDYWFREDRLPLPVFMLRQKDNGLTFSVFHKDADGSTFKGEKGPERITDARMKFAAVGMRNSQRPIAGLLFPGSEGERTGISGMHDSRRWAYRSHPVTKGFTQQYRMAFRLSRTQDYLSALRTTWNTYYNLQNPACYAVDLNEIYRQQLYILDKYWKSIRGSAGVPFRIQVNGTVSDTDYNWNMGFVGQQIPNASLLIREGFRNSNGILKDKGEQMAGFWAAESLAPSGIPRTWYNPDPKTWRGIPTHMRTLGDGMNGLLMAWNFEKKNKVDKVAWLKTAVKVGDWLLSVQNKDGSFYQQYDFNTAAVVNDTKNNTSNVIPFLVDLHLVTGQEKYKIAAGSAGRFIFKTIYQNFNYAGGAADNPNVPDKEAISMSLRAFLALYDLDKEKHWLDAALQSAYYYQTWVYAWPVPIPSDDENALFPAGRNVTGLSPIATGNNGSDTYAAVDAFQVYRVYLYSGDTNLLNFSRLLLYNTKQYVNWNPADPVKGFAPGFLGEAMTVTVPRGHGVDYYLPLQAFNLLEPLIMFQDVFGKLDLDEIGKMPLSRRNGLHHAYSARRGFEKSF